MANYSDTTINLGEGYAVSGYKLS